MKLNVKALSLSFGLAWAILMFLSCLAASLFNWGVDFINLLGSIYPAYQPTLWGSLVGAFWGFISGIIWGGIIGYTYNKLILKLS